MKFTLYTNALSAHQIPLAREIASRVGAENFQYVYTSRNGQALQKSVASYSWIRHVPTDVDLVGRHDVDDWLENADVMLVGGIRPIDLIERRVKAGKKTFYMSERWFKPTLGILRLAWPPYFRMAKRFGEMLRCYDSLVYLPIGIHAARDMARLCGLMHGDLRCLFRAPRLEFERKPGGRILLAAKNAKDAKKYCLDKMRMWGYFVEKGRGNKEEGGNNVECCPSDAQAPLRILWVGRLLRLKRVDTIIRAVGELSTCSTTGSLTLDIYGAGPEEAKLKKMAARYGNTIRFHPFVSMCEVRKLMRSHDVYVFASNGYEGWGAVVSEALEEGMKVVGTYESGASATMLPETNLFRSCDWKMLEKRLSADIPCVLIGDWSVKCAAEQLMKVIL